MQIRSTNGWPVDQRVQAKNAAQRRQRLAAKRARRASAPGRRQSPLAQWLLVRRNHVPSCRSITPHDGTRLRRSRRRKTQNSGGDVARVRRRRPAPTAGSVRSPSTRLTGTPGTRRSLATAPVRRHRTFQNDNNRPGNVKGRPRRVAQVCPWPSQAACRGGYCQTGVMLDRRRLSCEGSVTWRSPERWCWCPR